MGTVAYYTILCLLIFVALMLIGLILIQKGRGGGLSSAFGGGGGSSAFGAKTGDVLTWATSIIFGIFIILAVALDLVVDSQYKSPAAIAAASGTPPAAVIPETPAPAPTPSPSPVLPTTQTTGSIQQTINNAATQATGAVKATTQPSGNLLKGLK